MTKFLKTIILTICLLIPLSGSAQFYVTGDDPGKLKWYSIETDHFQVIYPEGVDSLARIYARKIEGFRLPVSLTSGYLSGEGDGKKMPVVMHAYNAANGSVAWAPKRMDLFTLPSAYDPDPMPWSTMLAVHESRHITQMQFGMTGRLKPGNWFFGEMWNILASLVYPGISTMEGDAVITETAWTSSGRGRTADFLNYYMTAFDQGDFRNWYKWRFVSQKYNAPDYYSLGYLTIGGLRYLYDCPDFMSQAYHLSARKPLKFTSFRKTIENVSGKDFDEVFTEICDTMQAIWSKDAAARMPFIPADTVSAATKTYTDFTNLLMTDKGLYAIRKGHTDTPALVRIDEEGKARVIKRFAYQTSGIRWSPYFNRIYWSEDGTDERWSLQSRSRIMYMETGNEKTSGLKNRELLFNPAPTASQAHMAVTEYEVNGRSALNVISGVDGRNIRRYEAPDTLQLIETAWLGNDIYATAVSDNGYGIYLLQLDENIDMKEEWETILAPQSVKIKDFSAYGYGIYLLHIDKNIDMKREWETILATQSVKIKDFSAYGYGIYLLHIDKNIDMKEEWETILAPQPVKIKDFSSYGNELMFTCDRTGVNELYHLDPVSKSLTQKTSTRYGASDFQYSTDGEWLYYCSQTLDGKRIFRTHRDSLISRTADFTARHTYPIAERLASQERKAAETHELINEDTIEISGPERYRKLPHMFNIHSWTPVYVNVDNIMNMSYDYIWQAASLGASGIIQNRLATAVGEFGYSAHKDPFDPAKWRHSAHAELTYSGLYPVFEASVDFNDRAARQYKTTVYKVDGRNAIELASSELGVPYIEGRLSVYLPLSFSSGGWYKGFVPKITYRISNDMFDAGVTMVEMEEHHSPFDGGVSLSQNPVFVGRYEGRNGFRHSLSGSIRAYTMLTTASSAVYPKWGIGLELGAMSNLESSRILSPMGYVYAYGYTPGIMPEHGIRLTATHQTSLNHKAYFSQSIINILPRGFSSYGAAMSWLSIRNHNLTRITAEYAAPVFIGDISIWGRMFAIKRLVLVPHLDYTFTGNGSLLSAGGSLILDLHSILAFDWPCSIGVTASYNGGSAFNMVSQGIGIQMKHYHVGPTFNVTF